MSSNYYVVCLSHDPAAIATDPGYNRLEQAEERIHSGINGHADCDLMIVRSSGATVEIGCPGHGVGDNAPFRKKQGCRYGHRDTEWVNVGWLHVLAHARLAGALPESVARHHDLSCWTEERVWRLREELALELPPRVEDLSSDQPEAVRPEASTQAGATDDGPTTPPLLLDMQVVVDPSAPNGAITIREAFRTRRFEPMDPVHVLGAEAPPDAACRRMETRTCPPSYNGPCGDLPCARFESDDPGPWTEREHKTAALYRQGLISDRELNAVFATADEDAQRTTRRAELRALLDTALRGTHASSDEETRLVRHIEAEMREADTARSVAAGNERHVQVMHEELEKTHRRAEPLRAGRETWKGKAEEIERDRDRIAAELETADRIRAEAQRDRDQHAAVLTEVLGHFTMQTGDPDDPRVRTPWLPTSTVDRWRSVVAPTAERPWWVDVAEIRAELKQAQAAIERVRERCQGVRDRSGPGGMINATQVLGLLSPTWPDGNYEAPSSTEGAP